MAKGFFTQGVMLLTNGQITLGDVKLTLHESGFDVVKELPAPDEWALGGPTLILPFLPHVNGYAAVDVVNRCWPDGMGDPKSDPMIFGAWSMGHFGPLTYPGGLARAWRHCWSWPAGRTIAEGHLGFLRIRLSYVFGADPSSRVLPPDYDPVAEMTFLSRSVLALFKIPGVVCYFNPNGEVLCDERSFRAVWEPCAEQRKLPISLWVNTRLFDLNESLGFMDTVGNGQLEVRDIEAVFPRNKYDPAEVAYYLRNVTHYLLELDREMQTGEDIDGPGETDLSWTIEVLNEAVVSPPRRVVRLYPKDVSGAVRAAIAGL